MEKQMRIKKIKRIKKEMRILGVDDGYFDKRKSKQCLVVGVVFRGAEFMDGLISFYVTVDGDDATEKLIEAINKSKHKEQLSLIMISGIAVAGFNVIDIAKLAYATGLPVIVVSRRKPRIKLIKSVLKKIGKEDKISLIEKAGEARELEVKNKKIYFQFYGIEEDKAREILRLSLKHGAVPEQLRIAHIIATGITLGENRGRL
jgi:endonuclease V-like protein UPF0215 family